MAKKIIIVVTLGIGTVSYMKRMKYTMSYDTTLE